MKVIDAHIHFSNINSFLVTAREISKVDYSYQGYCQSFAQHQVVASVGMGLQETKKDGFPDRECGNPMLLDLHPQLPDNVYYCLGVNPYKLHGDQKNTELDK